MKLKHLDKSSASPQNNLSLKALDKAQLDEFTSSQEHSQFLQSSSWGEFQSSLAGQKSAGHMVWRFGVFNDNKLAGTAQIIGYQLPFKKSYLYCPRGPVLDNQLSNEQKETALKLILSKARDLTIQTSQTEEIFFRIEPTLEIGNWNLEIYKTKSIQPANTLILELSQSAEQLLSNMHQKTRYNIRLAEKHGVTIKEENDFNKVWPLFQQTSKRDKFNLHPKNYYDKMLRMVPQIKLVVAKHQGQIIAANLIGRYSDTVTYIHGASAYEHRDLMAPYLLQWEIIKKAKEDNYKFYDFHGIAPNDNNNHPWFGITRFKKGFGGQTISYPGTFDFVYEPGSYKLYKLLRQVNLFLKKL